METRQPEITRQALPWNTFFSVTQRKRNHLGEAYERTSRIKALFSWGTTRGRGPGAERPKTGKELFAEWENRRKFGIGHAKEPGGAAKRKRGASQSELRLTRSLVRVHAEEAVLTFCEVNWEAPFQGSFFEVIEDLLFDESGEEDQMARSSAQIFPAPTSRRRIVVVQSPILYPRASAERGRGASEKTTKN